VAPAIRHLNAVVFDMDGTLFDSSELVPDAYIATVAAVCGRRVTRDSVITGYAVGPPKLLLGHLLGREARATEVAAYHETLRRMAPGLQPYRGIAGALAALAAHVPLGLFTGADRIACTILLEAAGLASCFDVVVGSDEVPRAKPEPDGIVEACSRLDVRPSAAAYVGDSVRDLQAARRSGALAVAAAWGHEYDASGPADVVAAWPEDLLGLVT
jgi:HAD superfamily hydrolase (TIGR01549 family)